jgi:hypothetical protein
MAAGKPPAIRQCQHPDHPAKRHGHYGYGGAHWCSDFGSPALGEDNMGHIERGWIVIFEKRGSNR